ncbi:uncharacterized protein LOC108914733 [Anoplophora glabripennis]|uniref:uncharacterized protein LOC108914733 n=1 Tax=Anoplophora glabripennis TaxID=217634 RepID=UPI000C769F2F|nr:uncharacterized protein LOC108914733 [Anoplophora glabripennis]
MALGSSPRGTANRTRRRSLLDTKISGMRLVLLLIAGASLALSNEDSIDTDGEESRKILGSSVVTSVSVIMDTGNGSKTVFTDAVGKPVAKPSSASELASPIDLLNPDRYEFYTFDDNGDLIKRLMSLEEIQGIIATGDSDGYDLDSFTSLGYLPEKRVNDVVNNVQNVLKEEMETHKAPPDPKPIFDTPDVSDSWSMILPAVFGNSGEDIKPERPITHVTPDTIMVEPNMQSSYPSTSQKNNVITTSSSFVTSASTPRSTLYSQPIINVEIYSNSKSTTEKPFDQLGIENSPVVEIKPNTTDVPKISATPTTTTRKPPTTVKIEVTSQTTTQMEVKLPSIITEGVTKQPSTLPAFTPSSLGSTLPTTKTPTKQTTQQVKTESTTSIFEVTQPTTMTTPRIPVLTKHTTEGLSTWRPEPFSAAATETQTVTEEVPLSTWIPTLTTEKIQTSANLDDLPTLAELLNLNKNSETKPSEPITTTMIPEATENDSSTIAVLSDNIIKKEPTTTEYPILETSQIIEEKLQSTERNVPEDLTTLGSDLLTTKLNKASLNESQLLESTTQMPLQSTNDDQKGSATVLLDQLLITTNIYEINTELAEKTTEQQIFIKTEPPTTTEQFLIKVTEQNDEPTDKNLINSIEQLLSQAVGNVEEALTAINDTKTIQEMLDSTGSKNMSDVQKQSATLASSLIDSNNNSHEENEKTTTEMSMLDAITSGEFNILSDSVGSLLSQVYEITFLLPETTTVTEKDEITESTTITYVPINTINKDSGGNSSKGNDFVPHLINITIISTDDTKTNIRNSSYKPAKLDVSLEESLDEELQNNATAQSTEIYIEQITTSTDISNEKIPNEILKAEETMAALYDSDPDPTTTIQPVTETLTDLPETQETTELSTEESTVTAIETLAPIKETPVERRPTTVVIIKKTEKPPTEKYSTTTIKTGDSVDTTTISDENLLESTTYSKLYTDITETISPTTTELNQEDTETERITEKLTDVKPFLEVVISEDNKNISESTKLQYPMNQTSNTDSTQIDITKTENNKKDEAKPPLINSIKISTQSLKKDDSGYPSKNQEQKPSESIAGGKPEGSWTLVPTVAPHSGAVIKNEPSPLDQYPELIDPPEPVNLEAKPLQGFGLEDSTSRLDTDIYQFAQLCNELAFGFWKTVTGGLSSARSVFVSPFGATSLLAMVFLGARGATSGEMNEILRLDDMVTFNPHLIFKNVSESVKADEIDSGVASSAIIRELFSDRSKGKLLPFYKERAKAFYDGYVEEVSFREIGDVIRRRTNLQVKKYTNGKTSEYLKDSSINARSPLAGVSVNIFQTDCSQASTEGRDGELHFVVLPSIRQRRLIPVPAVVYKSGFLAGYEPSLDATAISLGTKDQTVSTILVIPGQQGISAPGDGLSRLEKRLVESSFKKGAWSRLLRSLIPRPGLEVQIPRFSHRSVINATVALKKMGLHDLFDVDKADLRGLNGVANELFLSDMLQINSFATCGEKRIGESHHSEIYPATALRSRNSRYLEHFESEESFWRSDLLEEPRDYQRAFHDPLHDPSFLSLPLPLRPRQARVPDSPRLRFDRPFIYFIRHNPTGLILHMGRFNPRLLP